jgi:hypothetical protein
MNTLDDAVVVAERALMRLIEARVEAENAHSQLAQFFPFEQTNCDARTISIANILLREMTAECNK